MPRDMRSWFRKSSHRYGNAKDREGPKNQEPDGCDARTVAVVTSCASSDHEDSSVSTARIDTSRPAKIPAATSRSAPRLPVAPATDSTDTETSVDADSATASLPVRLWDRAYDDLKREERGLVDAYEKILSRQLQGGPGSAVPESQPNTIAQSNLDARRRQMAQLIHAGLDKTAREAKVKEGLGVAVDVVLSARDIISSAIQAVPQAALAWTGICLALEVLANPVTATETNRKGIDYVVKRLDWYWGLSGNLLKDLPDHAGELSGVRRELENQIVELYKALLSYQSKSVCSYYRNRGLVFLRDMVKLDDWYADLGAIQDAETRFRDDTQAYTTQQVTSHLEQLVSHAKNQEMRQMSEKDHQCLKHLRLTDPCDDKARIERAKGGVLQDSYRWVLDNPEFQRWRDEPDSRLLWIKGNPGKGKTMLLCGIINELDRDSTADASRRNLAYFFCQATDSRINNATAVLRGLIYLLVDQQPSLLSHVRSEYDRAGELLCKHGYTWDALSRIFTNILRDSNLRMTFLVIDALDECVTDLPQLLDLIAQKSSGSSRVKWIVSSRNWPEIEEQLDLSLQKARLSLELNAEAVAAAVKAYIGYKVDQLARQKHYDTSMRAAVHDYLSSHANDTFLWVSLVCQALADPKIQKWRALQKSRTFPPGLDSLYARMIDYIRDSEDSDLCKHILAVATIVRRPVSLQELTSLVEMPGGVSDDRESLEKIIELCGSFLTLRDQTVYFVHQSAQDFLLGKASDKTSNTASQTAFGWVFPSGTETVDHAILSRSLDAMSTALRRDIYGLSALGFPIDSVRVPDPDPLATIRYSCVYWVDHLCHSVSGTSTHRHDFLQDDSVVYTFLKAKYLYWLEALSLLRAMPEGVISISQLEGLLGQNDGRQLTNLVRDAHRFALSYRWIIEQAPLQAYSSALVFAPAGSLIKTYFKAEEPDWIRTKPTVEADWNACLQTLEGHGRSVQSVAFSPDGRRLASGSGDNTVKLWDAASGRCLETLEGHGDWVYSVAFSPDGQRLASGSADKTVKIWDAASGRCLETLRGYGGWVSSVAFSPDSQRLASGLADKTIKIWDAASGRCLETLRGHGGWVRSVAFSPDSQRLASSSGDNTVKIWDAGSGRCLETLEGHGDWVYSVAFSPDGQRLASGSYDKTVKIWDASSGRCLETLRGHIASVRLVAFSPDGQLLASGSDDKTIKIWDAASGRCLETTDIGRSITHISFDHTDSYLLTNIGRIKTAVATTESLIKPDDPEGHGYGLGQDLAWIACNGQNVLWLPSEYRPSCFAVQGRMISIGCASGRVYSISFSRYV